MEEKFLSTLIGTQNLNHNTSSTKLILKATMELYEKIINKDLLVRRINVTANNITSVLDLKKQKQYEQIDLFNDYKRDSELLEKELISFEEANQIIRFSHFPNPLFVTGVV